MIQQIRNIFDQVFLDPLDLVEIASISSLKKVDKGVHLVSSGEFNYKIITVVKGLLRHYCIDENGMDRTMLFVAEKETTGSMETIFHDKPAYENIVALEDSIVILFDNRKMEKIASKSKGLLRLQNKNLKKNLSEAVERLRHHTILSPEEHYDVFCMKHPKLEQRIKQKYLASYLGITPTSLSRLRARVIQKNANS